MIVTDSRQPTVWRELAALGTTSVCPQTPERRRSMQTLTVPSARIRLSTEGRVNTVRHGCYDPYRADGPSAVPGQEHYCSPCRSVHACDIGWVEESREGSIPCAGNAGTESIS